jgi:hypothetical protein
MLDCGASAFERMRRREPAAGCVSTLEALAVALGQLEGPMAGGGIAQALLRAFDAAVSLQAQFVPAGPLTPADFASRAPTVPVGLPLATPAPPPASHIVHGPHRGRVSAYVICSSRHDVLTGRTALVPLENDDSWRAAAAAGALVEAAAMAAGLLWCTFSEATTACAERNTAERRKRGHRLVVLPAAKAAAAAGPTSLSSQGTPHQDGASQASGMQRLPDGVKLTAEARGDGGAAEAEGQH